MAKVQQPAKLSAKEANTSLHFEPSRRDFLAGLTGTAVVAAVHGTTAVAVAAEIPVNIAPVAVPSCVALRSENKISALNDGFQPENSFDRTHGVYVIPSDASVDGSQPWVQYDWSIPVTVNKVEVYWAVDRPRSTAPPGSSDPRVLIVPQTYRILYWSGGEFVPVREPK